MAEEAFAAEMRRRAAIQLFLAEPEPPVYSINIDDQPVKVIRQRRLRSSSSLIINARVAQTCNPPSRCY
jgi:hypothetical protein